MLRGRLRVFNQTWWDHYSTNPASTMTLKALAERDRRGRTFVMQILSDNDYYEVGCAMLIAIETIIKNGVSVAEVLAVLSMKDEMGANMLHTLAYTHDEMMTMRWFSFLENLLDYDMENRIKNRDTIYQMLRQTAAYHSNLSLRDKPVDRMFARDIHSLDIYISLVLKLARNGLPRTAVDQLLESKDHDLKKLFWKKVSEQHPSEMLELIIAGFLHKAELPQFVEHKAEMLEYVLESDDAASKKKYLQSILNSHQPLGQLFLLKSRYEFRDLNVNHGLLQTALQAALALSLQRPQSSLRKNSLLAAPIEKLDEEVTIPALAPQHSPSMTNNN